MTISDEICALIEEIQRLVRDNMGPDGSCKFDPVRVKIALEFVKTEIEKSVRQEKGKSN